mgnify:CR=1 FL=1
MSSIFVTFEVSNEERSRVWSFEQPESICFMLVTFEVSNEERSRD